MSMLKQPSYVFISWFLRRTTRNTGTTKKNLGQLYVEFAWEKGTLFDKWLSSCKVNDLRETLLVEEFKRCLPNCTVVHLNKQKVTSLSRVAVLADECVLTHKTPLSPFSRTEGKVLPLVLPQFPSPPNPITLRRKGESVLPPQTWSSPIVSGLNVNSSCKANSLLH